MASWLWLVILAQYLIPSIFSAPVALDLYLEARDLAPRTASPQSTPQIASYVILHPPAPQVSVVASPPHLPYRVNSTTDYHVPGTQTTLHLEIYDHPMPPALIKSTLLQLAGQMREHLHRDGDGWLSYADDPYESGAQGCVFWAKSNPDPGPGIRPRRQHLTYGILSSVAAGLLQWMVVGGRTEVVRFDIEDGHWGIVGFGMLAPY